MTGAELGEAENLDDDELKEAIRRSVVDAHGVLNLTVMTRTPVDLTTQRQEQHLSISRERRAWTTLKRRARSARYVR